MQPEFTGVSQKEPVPEPPSVPIEHLTARREPFWNYVDVLLFIGIGCALIVLVLGPLVFFAQVRGRLDTNALLLSALLQYLPIYFGLKIVFRMRYREPVFRSLGWRPSRVNLGIMAITGVALAFAIDGIAVLIHTPKVPSPVDQFANSVGGLIVISLIAVTGAPIFEELLFRGFLQPLFSRTFGVALGIFITALLFGALHIPEYQKVWQYGFAITLVGVVLGYVRQRSGSIIPGTVMHASFNAMSVIALIASKFQKH